MIDLNVGYMLMLRKWWRASLILVHISSGLVLLVLTGAVWRPHTVLVKATKQWWLGRIPRILGMRVEVIGESPKANEGPYLLISNHVSWIDIPLIGGLMPTCFVAKSEVAQWPVIGTLAAKAGTLFIKRGSGDTERVALNMAQTLAQGRSVLFFPEGTTTDGTYLKRFHTKLFNVCQHRPVTVQPIIIRYWTETGENPVPFIDDHEFASHLWQMMGHRDIHASIELLPPLCLDGDSMHSTIATAEAQMRQTLARQQTSTALRPHQLFQ